MDEGGMDASAQASSDAVRANLAVLQDRLKLEADQALQQGSREATTVKDYVGFIYGDIVPIVSPLVTSKSDDLWIVLGQSRKDNEDLTLGYDIRTGKLTFVKHPTDSGEESVTTSDIGQDPADLDNLPDHEKSLLKAVAGWGKDSAVRTFLDPYGKRYNESFHDKW